MPPACRTGDNAHCPNDSHGNSCCSHSVTGPAKGGSPDVVINGKPAFRLGDQGVHSKCCGANSWKAAGGSATVFVNGKSMVRLGDATKHCGGKGKLVEGSMDVEIG